MNGRDMLKRKLERLLKEPENHELYNDIGAMLYELKDYENAQNYLKKAWELSPSDANILYNYAHALYALFEWRRAAEVFGAYLELRPKDRAAIEKTADAYYQLGEYGLAATCIGLLSEQGGRLCPEE
jgi:tetratricopeptide (TPR) repeat protein